MNIFNMPSITELPFTFFVGIVILCISMSLGKLLLAYRNDYQPIASLFKAENSQGFNAIFRIAIAPICIIVMSIVLYFAGHENLTRQIWLSAVWYLLLQVALIAILERWSLVSKPKFIVFHAASIALSYYVYSALIIKGVEHLLPDEANLRTDIWLVIVAFLYGIFHSIPENLSRFEERKKKYIRGRLKVFEEKYSVELKKYDLLFQNILLAVMLYEDFNRPRVVRFMESLVGAKTRGIMQVSGVQTDEESIRMSAAAFKKYYMTLKDIPRSDYKFHETLIELFKIHNPSDASYPYDVKGIFELVEKDRSAE